ncbi:MAG: hypothetical protein M1819_007467 [Sarea resinae]|nr:MAG: hypothetical protein M1819_007467 [Sarea resinae]
MPKAITIKKVDGKPGKVYYPLQTTEVPTPIPSDNQLLIRLTAASVNHRDLFIRQHLYPGTTFSVPLLADGCGLVISTGSSPTAKSWLHKRVILNPGSGWADSAEGPEDPSGYRILGGTKLHPLGTLQDLVCIDASEVEEAPLHLDSVESAAIPLTGLTAYRALFTKSGNAKPGHNILITGIGGGVALMALLFAAAAGCNAFVTSGSEEKLQRAKQLGAQGGVNYKAEGWEKKLVEQLPSDRKYIDAIIDGAGGNIVEKGAKILKVFELVFLLLIVLQHFLTSTFCQPGGVIVSYGMTTGPSLPYLMSAVLKNIEIRGSTMGSRAEFASMVSFVATKQLRPIISRTVRLEKGMDDLEKVDALFEDMKAGSQFGKLVIDILGEDVAGETTSKL